MTRRQAGMFSKLTAAEIHEIRSVYARFCDARNARRRIQKSLDLTPDQFRKYAQGIRGKKPREET